MHPTVSDVSTLDTTWQQVAASLGTGWTWQRQDPAYAHGSLDEPDGLRLWIQLRHSRWEIREALDTVVPGTSTRLVVAHLYGSSEPKPATSISVAADRPAATIAREIARRLLPDVRDALTRLNARRLKHIELASRRQRAVDAILRVVPSAHQRHTSADRAPHLFIGAPLALDVLIDDADCITITHWSRLDVDTTLRLLAIALASTNSA